MDLQQHEPLLTFPFLQPPAPGQTVEVAPGLLWARFELPFSLNHVNVYFIADGDGWAAFDCGIASDSTREQWQALLDGPLAGQRLTRLIISHHHPDHIGLAGWLCERYNLKLLMSQAEYLEGHYIALNPDQMAEGPFRQFYVDHGLSPEAVEIVLRQGHGYLRMVTPLPHTFRRLVHGERLRIGEREFEIYTGGGHSSEQVMLYCRAENLFVGADQVLAKISPNVSVWAMEPEGDPLGLYRRSLRELQTQIDADALVLPGHNLPFRGLHLRLQALEEHHAHRCAQLVDACRARPHSASDLVPVMFPRELDPHQLSFAFSEVLAHVNYLVDRDQLRWTPASEGGRRLVAA
ncbi:MBL fold metallo-hydrolase [Camelimonas sp. ID_303_24]